MNTTVHGQKLASLHFTVNDISLTMEHYGEKYQNLGSSLNRENIFLKFGTIKFTRKLSMYTIPKFNVNTLSS
jgi:hypothetical protein